MKTNNPFYDNGNIALFLAEQDGETMWSYSSYSRTTAITIITIVIPDSLVFLSVSMIESVANLLV
ncbi:MAG: hypothetical protein U5J63_11615 [Fodinibius sp.]|nr:hypothetical protein [Fodinibius sp.]